MQIKFVDLVIEVKGLNYKNIIKDISFEIKRGDYVAIIGPNGGGKSTLVKLILSLLKKDSGEIKLFSKRQEEFRLYQKIGYVAQGVAQVDSNFPITAEEVVSLGFAYKQSIFSQTKKSDRVGIDEIMNKLDIYELRKKRISELSGGQRQRVMIARALVSNPQILILDEPNTGIDTHSQKKFYELLRELNRDENITILFITHDLGVIADDVKTVLCINQTLLDCHNPKELLNCENMSKLYGIKSHLVCHRH